MLPYPTVVIVTIAQYTPRGMLVNPAAGPSIRYIGVPATTAIEMTATRMTVILVRLSFNAC